MIRAWVDATLKPILTHALKVMPMTTFAGIMIGYGVACGRSIGRTKAQLREVLETALAEHPDP